MLFNYTHTHNQKKKQRFNQFIDNSNTVTKERSCVWCNLKIREKNCFKRGKKGNWNGSIHIFVCEIILQLHRETASRMEICNSHLLMCCDTWKKSNTPKLQKKEIDSELNIMISRFNGHFTSGWVWANSTVWLGEIHMLQRETLSILAYFVKC